MIPAGKFNTDDSMGLGPPSVGRLAIMRMVRRLANRVIIMQLIVFKFDYILLLRSVSVVAEFVRPSVRPSVCFLSDYQSVRPSFDVRQFDS